MKNITITLYSFDELNEQAKRKALNKLSDINVSDDWWGGVYEDAKRIGLKITGFDLYEKQITGKFILNPEVVVDKIVQEHGANCETYKTAKKFISNLEKIESKFTGEEDDRERNFEIEELEDIFLKSLLTNYLTMLKTDFEYLTSEVAIIETIESNDYMFEEDGTLTKYKL